MIRSFENAPVIEIIAELRWNQPGAIVPDLTGRLVNVPIQLTTSSELEEFFMAFGGAVHRLGFTRAERVVPPNFPTLLFQPVYRYRAPDLQLPAVFQLGAGLFSANATPPYRSWDDFVGVIRDGVRALLEARNEKERDAPFSKVSVRYIDAFRADLLGDRVPSAFISEVLGFHVEMPPAVSSCVAGEEAVKTFLQANFQTENEMTVTLSIGEGTVSGTAAVVMDTTVAAVNEVAPDLDAVMDSLNSARGVIHNVFIGMTSGIHAAMRPIEG